MGSYESFYQGSPKSTSYYSTPSSYQSQISNLGISMDPRTANQLGELNLRLNPGVKTIEIQGTFANVLESIPEQHLEEMRRVSKLTGSDLTLHGPLLNASGVEQQGGYSEENRLGAERQMESALLRARSLRDDGKTVVTFHSTANLPNFNPHIIKDGKKIEQGMMIIDQTTGQIGQIKDEGRYLGEDAQFTGEKLAFDPKVELQRRNKEFWLGNLSSINQSVEFGERAIENAKRRGGDKYYEIATRDINTAKAEEDKQVFREAKREFEYGSTYLKESYRRIRDLFDKAMDTTQRTGREADKKRLREFAEFAKGKIARDFENNPQKIEVLREVVQEGISTLSSIKQTPQTFRPLRDFTIEKSAETFANIAQTAYNTAQKDKRGLPIISIENPPGGEGLSTGEDIKDLVQNSRSQLAKNLKNQGLPGSEAERVAATMIGATWDVGHINMMRKKGYSEKDIIEETKKVAKFVKHVHLSDNFGLDHTELPMGMGNVPLKPMIDAIKKAGFKGKEIIEAGNWWQHFADKGGGNPFKPSIEGMDSPIYAMTYGPGWANTGRYGAYFSGHGPVNPALHHTQLYGAGFQNLPLELGGEIAGDRGRFSGNPNQ